MNDPLPRRAIAGTTCAAAVIAQILHCVHGDGEQLLPAPCPGLIAHLQRESTRIDEAITQLQASRQALDALLTTAQSQSRVDSP